MGREWTIAEESYAIDQLLPCVNKEDMELKCNKVAELMNRGARKLGLDHINGDLVRRHIWALFVRYRGAEYNPKNICTHRAGKPWTWYEKVMFGFAIKKRTNKKDYPHEYNSIYISPLMCRGVDEMNDAHKRSKSRNAGMGLV